MKPFIGEVPQIKFAVTSNETLQSKLNRIGDCTIKGGLLYWMNKQIRKIDIDSVNLGGDTRIILKGTRKYLKVDIFEIKCAVHPLDVTRLTQLEKDKVKRYKFKTGDRAEYLKQINNQISKILQATF